jgi:SAM-dependent methyltransferase
MPERSWIIRAVYFARDLRSRSMFHAVRECGGGQVLDVGGGDFFLTARRRKLPYRSWTTVEPSHQTPLPVADPAFRLVYADGCRLPFRDESFDAVVNLQVLEHVMEPLEMVGEMARVLRSGGRAVLLVPQTSTLHLAPRHYYNFTRYWIEEAARRHGLEILELAALGGVWSSAASHMVYFFLQSFRHPGMSPPDIRRKRAFYLLYPLMALFAAISIPIMLLLSLGDLEEEPNNHLVTLRKP